MATLQPLPAPPTLPRLASVDQAAFERQDKKIKEELGWDKELSLLPENEQK